MKITKYGHCCLLVEEGGVRILTDPGGYSTRQSEARGVDLVLFTHEHPDHYHLESLKTVLANNPQAKVMTNRGVGALLAPAGVAYELLEHGGSVTLKGVKIEGFGEKHATIYPGVREVVNTGFFVGDRLFYPGDSFFGPGKRAEILALPVAGPWMRIAEAIDYAKALKPKVCFPVHDGMLKIMGGTHRWPQEFLPPEGIAFQVLEENKETAF